MSDKIKVIPCSGMGKVYGLVAREAAFKVVNELCPDISVTECLAYIVTGDEEAKKKIEGHKCITLDGCPLMCSAKSTEAFGGIVMEKYRVIDAFRQHKGAKPGTATELTEEGWTITDELAQKISERVQILSEEE